jgi:aspartyl-tRNA(Asn)/glutamyl-tRNA(Gln) amidotransferase subunit B
VERVRATLPELPRARSERYQRDLGLSAYDAALLTGERAVAELFDATLERYGRSAEAAKRVANWLTGEGARLANETGVELAASRLDAGGLAGLLRLVDAGAIGGPGAKQVFETLFREGGDPEQIVRAKGLAQVSDEGAIEAIVDRVVAASPGEVERYRGGNKKLLGFFVGQVMKEMKGKGNPAVVNALLKKKLGD